MVANASAMTFTKIDESTIAVNGLIVDSDLIQIKELLRLKQLKTLIIKESIGGDMETSLLINYYLKDKIERTVIEGYCNSACPLLFLAGKNRKMLPGSFIAFHSTYRYDNGQIHYQLQNRNVGAIKDVLKDKFDPVIWDKASSLKVNQFVRFSDTGPAEICTRENKIKTCVPFISTNVIQLGIITE